MSSTKNGPKPYCVSVPSANRRSTDRDFRSTRATPPVVINPVYRNCPSSESASFPGSSPNATGFPTWPLAGSISTMLRLNAVALLSTPARIFPELG